MSDFNKLEDTIIAPATQTFGHALSVIRMSGADAFKICSRLVKNPLAPKHKTARLVEIIDKNKLLDKVILTSFKKPFSFTGEDTVEISCHGSPYIVSEIISLAIKYGARPADVGEFTMRAFLNEKLDLAQAEGICDLINSQNRSSHRAAINLTEGKISKKLSQIKNGLIDMLAQIEVRLDDPDEELDALSAVQITRLLKPISKKIKELADTFNTGRLITGGIKVSIVGVPNCGKSSLLNYLLESDRAITSHIPGTTRDTIEASIELDGKRFILIDTAGIRRHVLDPAEKEGMRRSQKAMDKSDIILFVTDINNAKTACDRKLWHEIKNHKDNESKEIIKIINKSDLLKGKKTKKAFEFAKTKASEIKISCKTGVGIDILKRKISKAFNLEKSDTNQLIITSLRHYDGLKKALAELLKINPLLKQKNIQTELLAEHIRTSLNDLENIIGKTTSQDVLDVVFKKFCLGK